MNSGQVSFLIKTFNENVIYSGRGGGGKRDSASKRN